MAEKKDAGRRQVPLRLSAALYDELQRWAEDEFRSLNGQIEYLLSQAVKRRRGADDGDFVYSSREKEQ